MERGRTFYIAVANGLVALGLLLTSVNLPTYLVLETKPYAFVVLKSGKLEGWTAEELGITSVQLNMVKNNYAQFLSRHRTADDSSSEDSGDSDSEDQSSAMHVKHVNYGGSHLVTGGPSTGDKDQDDDDDVTGSKKAKMVQTVGEDDSSSSSSSDEDDSDSSSDSAEMTLEQRLKDKPLTQTARLGLFRATICSVLKSLQERCHIVSVNEAIFALKQDVPFVENDINMPMWNNLRVESLFSVVTCVIGLICLCASLKPCCDNRRLPVYLGSLSFFLSGVLVFIPIVRVLLVSSDFKQSLATSLNVTAQLMTSWSLVASGVGAIFALLASFALIATKWFRVTKKLYHVIKTNPSDPEHVPNGILLKQK